MSVHAGDFRRALFVCVLWIGVLPTALVGQASPTGAVRGLVTAADFATPVGGIAVSIEGTSLTVTTALNGRYLIRQVPAGRRVLQFRSLGYQSRSHTVDVVAGDTVVVDVALEPVAIRLGELTVESASRLPERVTDAPAAIAVVDRAAAVEMSIGGQAPKALTGVPGVDVVQSGGQDFNVNSRGFNSSLNRRMLVLQDGRDLAVPLLGFQEWAGLSSPLSDYRSIEVVRGPGAALYGANAYNGVINLRSPRPRDIVGTRMTVAGGELGSLHADVRHAGVLSEGRFGYKVNVGHDRNDTWNRARTSADRADLRREYAGVTDATVPDVMEAVPLFGQTLDAATRRAVGEPDPERSTYGSARFDAYTGNSVLTAEAGGALVENTTLVTGIGRIQVDRALRPWARLAWDRDELSASVWYSGRSSLDDPHMSLSSGAPIADKSTVFQAEIQANRTFANERARVVVGGSARNTRTNTDSTLFAPSDDDRSDSYGSAYAQVEFEPFERLALVGALRYDAGSLFDAQVSPRFAAVYSLDAGHSLRFTVHRAFQTPTQLEQFLRVPAARPANLGALEAGLRASPLGPALAGVPNGTLFTTSSAVPVLALGNDDLDVETVRSFELGYRGQLGDLDVSVEGYYSRLSNFVTDLLPGANPEFGPWTAPTQVPQSARATVEQTVRSQLLAANQRTAALGMTRLASGNTAIVVSYANAGSATEQGIEIAVRYPLAAGLETHATYTWFDFRIDESSLLPGDVLQPNTPRHKGNIGASYRRGAFDAGANAMLVDGFDWAAGVFAGPVPSRQLIDVRAGYYLRTNLRLQLVATNVLDQRRYQIYGGSLIGRRVLGGLTLAF
jgi:iron complex outermembrane receptor protein